MNYLSEHTTLTVRALAIEREHWYVSEFKSTLFFAFHFVWTGNDVLFTGMTAYRQFVGRILN